MPHFSFMELVIIMVVILLLFGAKRIPEIAGSVGKGIKEFKKEMNDMERNVTGNDSGVPPRLTAEDLNRPAASTTADAEKREPRRLL
ncbi:MAG: twin-arginine translocase TatA/TatE family subunit [Gemmatimonadota bacterium]|nr:twin-arginine translocase TatA/TatE family subunit [Gemmatimonadota bacterium]